MCLNFSELLAGLCGSVVARQRDKDTKRSGYEVRVRPWVAIYFLFNRSTLITGQKFSECLMQKWQREFTKGTELQCLHPRVFSFYF